MSGHSSGGAVRGSPGGPVGTARTEPKPAASGGPVRGSLAKGPGYNPQTGDTELSQTPQPATQPKAAPTDPATLYKLNLAAAQFEQAAEMGQSISQYNTGVGRSQTQTKLTPGVGLFQEEESNKRSLLGL